MQLFFFYFLPLSILKWINHKRSCQYILVGVSKVLYGKMNRDYCVANSQYMPMQWRLQRGRPLTKIFVISCIFSENLANLYAGAPPPAGLAPPPMGNPGSGPAMSPLGGTLTDFFIKAVKYFWIV